MRYKFSDGELKEIYKKLVILVDTREQTNDHILKWFDSKGIKYKRTKVDYGDYSCYLPVGSFKGQTRDIYFDRDIVVERKFCIDELAMNLKDNKTAINEITKEVVELLGEKYLQKVLKCDYNRFKYELTALNKYDIDFNILIEDVNFDYNLRTHNYRSKYDPERLMQRLKGIEAEFRTTIRPTHKGSMGSEIYNTLKYGVRHILKNKGYLEEEGMEVVREEAAV